MAKLYTISRFSRKTDRSPKSEDLSWPVIAALLSRHDERSGKDGALFSPVLYRDNAKRGAAGVEHISLLVLDFDQGHDWEDFCACWDTLSLAYVVYTTHSHTQDHPKWRAVFPLIRPVLSADWSAVYRKLSLALGHGLADPACSDASRMYYLPSCEPGWIRYAVLKESGRAVDPTQFPEAPDEEVVKTPVPDGVRPGDVFNEQATWESMLEPAGWTKFSERGGWVLWTRPGKNRKDGPSARTGPGTAGDRFYCWSSAIECAVPSNKLLTKFALFTHLSHGGDYRAAARSLAPSSPDALPRAELAETVLPVITVTDRQLPEVTADALAAMRFSNDPPEIFVRSGELVRVEIDERGLARIAPLSESSLKGILARCADWRAAMSKNGVRSCSPPLEVVKDILSLASWQGFPPITIVSKSPVAGRSGQVQMSSGYDPQSGVYVSGGPFEQWNGDAASALAFIREELLVDFPFASDADFAGAMSLVLLPFVRPIIEGPTPLHLVDAPVQGTGKSLLVRTCLWPALGCSLSATTATRDEEEWRKKVSSNLLEGRPAVFLDNLSRKLDSEALAAVLTSTEWNDRALGSLATISVPVRCVWAATANNAELSRDLARRTVWIRLDAHVELPEQREGFRHSNIEQWAKNNRGLLISACCKLVDTWIAAGRPLWCEKKLGSFEDYCSVVGGILSVIGVKDYLANIDEMRASVSSLDEDGWAEFYMNWYKEFGSNPVKASDLHKLFLEVESLGDALGDKGETSQKTRLGRLLARRTGLICGGLAVEKTGIFRKATTFRLVPANSEKSLQKTSHNLSTSHDLFGISTEPLTNLSQPPTLKMEEPLTNLSPSSHVQSERLWEVSRDAHAQGHAHDARIHAHTPEHSRARAEEEKTSQTSQTSHFEPKSAPNEPDNLSRSLSQPPTGWEEL